MIYFPVWYISFLGHTLIYLTLNVFIWTLCTPHKIHVHERKTRWLMIDARSWEDKKIREISTNKCIIMNRIFCKILWFVLGRSLLSCLHMLLRNDIVGFIFLFPFELAEISFTFSPKLGESTLPEKGPLSEYDYLYIYLIFNINEFLYLTIIR